MQLDDLGRGQELARAGAEELREQGLEPMAGTRRAVPHHEPGRFERGHKLARRAPCRHRHVLLEALEERPAKKRVLILARSPTEDLAVEVRVKLRATSSELSELTPSALANERSRESQARGPAAGAAVDRVDGVLGQVEAELAAQQLDRLGPGERELRGRDVQDGASQAPARKTAELRRPPGGKNKVRVVGKKLDELAPEARERGAALHARVVVHEDDKVAEWRELVGKRLCELRKPSLEASPTLERSQELLAELGVVAAQRADQVGEEDERVLVAALEGEPCHAPAGGADKVGMLREEGRLAVAGRGMHERQSMPVRATQPIQQPLPLQERKRKRRWRVPRSVGPSARDGQGAKDALRPRAKGWRSRSRARSSSGS